MSIRALIALLPVLLALGGCGFTPLYADSARVAPALRDVEVIAPQGRAGFLVRQQLEDELGRDRSGPARYRLTYTIQELRFPRGLRVNEIADEYELDLNVNYQLTDLSSGKVVHAGFAPAQVSYASADAPYAGVVAQQSGQERAASQAAILIRLDLSRYFAMVAQSGPAQVSTSSP